MPGGGGGTPQAQEQSQESTSTTVTEPDPFLRGIQQQFLQSFPKIKGKNVAPLAPQSLLANTLATQFATDPSSFSSQQLADLGEQFATSPLVANTVGGNLQTLNTLSNVNNLDPRSNPFTAAAADVANRQTISTLRNQVLPSIRDSAVSAGQFGGSRQGVAEGLALTGASQAIADTTTRAFFDQFNQNANRAITATQVANQVLTIPPNLLSNAINNRNAANQQAMQMLDVLDKSGQQLQQQAQNEIDGEVRKWMMNNQFPLQVVSAVGGLTAGGTSTTTSSASGTTVGPPVPAVSPIQGALGGAMAGAGIASMLPASMATMNPWIIGGTAALGLLSSL